MQGFEPRGTSIHGWNEATTRLMSRLYDVNGSLSFLPPDTSEPAVVASVVSADDVTRRRRREVDECLSERLEGVAQRINTAAVIKPSIENSKTLRLLMRRRGL